MTVPVWWASPALTPRLPAVLPLTVHFFFCPSSSEKCPYTEMVCVSSLVRPVFVSWAMTSSGHSNKHSKQTQNFQAGARLFVFHVKPNVNDESTSVTYITICSTHLFELKPWSIPKPISGFDAWPNCDFTVLTRRWRRCGRPVAGALHQSYMSFW